MPGVRSLAKGPYSRRDDAQVAPLGLYAEPTGSTHALFPATLTRDLSLSLAQCHASKLSARPLKQPRCRL